MPRPTMNYEAFQTAFGCVEGARRWRKVRARKRGPNFATRLNWLAIGIRNARLRDQDRAKAARAKL